MYTRLLGKLNRADGRASESPCEHRNDCRALGSEMVGGVRRVKWDCSRGAAAATDGNIRERERSERDSERMCIYTYKSGGAAGAHRGLKRAAWGPSARVIAY